MLAALLLIVPLAASCSVGPNVNEDFTDAELLAAMDTAVAESVAGLPDFPGFSERLINVDACFYGLNGYEESEEHDRLTVSYGFYEEYQDSTLLRQTYPDLLAEHWEALGFEVEHHSSDSGDFRSITAKRPDDITLRYRIAGRIGLETYLAEGATCILRDQEPISLEAGATGVGPEDTRFNDDVDRIEPTGDPQ